MAEYLSAVGIAVADLKVAAHFYRNTIHDAAMMRHNKSSIILSVLRDGLLLEAPRNVTLLGDIPENFGVQSWTIEEDGMHIVFTTPPHQPSPALLKSMWSAKNRDHAPSIDSSTTPRPPSYWENAGYVSNVVFSAVLFIFLFFFILIL